MFFAYFVVTQLHKGICKSNVKLQNFLLDVHNDFIHVQITIFSNWKGELNQQHGIRKDISWKPALYFLISEHITGCISPIFRWLVYYLMMW